VFEEPNSQIKRILFSNYSTTLGTLYLRN
jgi:hypothetical protein